MASPVVKGGKNDTPKNLLKKYQAALVRAGIPVDRLILFGSYAKGTAKPWSDMDVCVVSRVFGKNGYDEMVSLKTLAIPIEPMIEPHPYHPKDLRNRWDGLAHEIRTHGVVL